MQREFLARVLRVSRDLIREQLQPLDGGDSIDALRPHLRGVILGVEGVAEATGFVDSIESALEELDSAAEVAQDVDEMRRSLSAFDEALEALRSATPADLADEDEPVVEGPSGAPGGLEA